MQLFQLSPQLNARAIRMRIWANADAWSTASVIPGEVGFLSSWFEPNRELGDKFSPGLNWGALSGLALCFAVSAGFWTGLALFALRMWK